MTDDKPADDKPLAASAGRFPGRYLARIWQEIHAHRRGGLPPQQEDAEGRNRQAVTQPAGLLASAARRVHIAPMLFRPSPAAQRRPPGFIEPCIPTLASRPPTGPQWVHEIKHDGYRLIARKTATGSACSPGAATTGPSATR
jgi:ATP-dependent DNA ligase